MIWQVLIATQSRRQDKFLGLLDVLLPQCEKAGVHILACSNDGQEKIGAIRQRLLEASTGDYVSFIDDDDMVPDDFVEAIVPYLIDTPKMPAPDVIGFDVIYTYQGSPGPPSKLSIAYEPHDTAEVLYRDLTHVQPLKRELALLGDFRNGWPEDSTWRAAVRPHIRTEQYLPRQLYFYRHDPLDSVQHGTGTGEPRPRKDIDSPNFKYLDWPLSMEGTEAIDSAAEASPA